MLQDLIKEDEIRKDGWKLGAIPPKLRVYQICETACRQNGLS